MSEDHSLARELAASGVLVADPARVELARDEYVEALIAAATRVFQEALPYLEGGGDAPISTQTADERLAAGSTAASNVAKTRDDAASAVIEHLR